MEKYIAIRRTEEEIRSRGRALNLPGDPLDDPQPVADDLAGQLAAVNLWLNLPQHMRRCSEAWPMVRAVSFGPRRRAGQ